MKLGIALFPSKSLQDLANSYRKRYDSHYAQIPPHLTLRAAFDVSDEQLPAIVSYLQTVAAASPVVPIKVTKASSFAPVNHVIYLKVEPNDVLSHLHQALHADLLEATPEFAFVPHITIGQDLSDDEHADIVSQLKMTAISHDETVSRFHLLYQLENETWATHTTFELGGKS